MHRMASLRTQESLSASLSPRWFWIAAFWLGIGLFDASQTVFVMRAEGMHHAWTSLFITCALSLAPVGDGDPAGVPTCGEIPTRALAATWLLGHGTQPRAPRSE